MKNKIYSLPYQEFLRNNASRMDKILNRILWATLLAPVGVLIGILTGIYPGISIKDCLTSFFFILVTATLCTVLIYNKHESILSRYLCLIVVEVIIILMRVWGFGIFITIFFIPAFSLFYCDMATYLFSALFGYVGAGVAYFLVAPEYAENLSYHPTPMEYFSAFMVSLTFEYLFFFMAGFMVILILQHHLNTLYGNLRTIDAKEEEGYKDQLTGLWTTEYIEEAFDRTVAIQNHQSALLVFDLDNFKAVNDLYGHGEGDRAILLFADLLKHTFRDTDKCIVSRYGGDEFVVFMPFVEDEKELILCLERLKERFSMVFHSDSHLSNVTLSVGASFGNRDAMDFRTVFRAADKALLHVKRTGKNGFYLYDRKAFSEGSIQ